METKQETKSLPRNRKCGNCRYFEPAPLWRKGWCRNPRLYDRRANHLVDAATIDCEQVFRARIYWEPVPTPDVVEAEVGVSSGSYRDSRFEEGFPEPYSADGGGQARNSDGVLRPSTGSNRPVINRREKAAATPVLVGKPSAVRKWLIENIPYYERIDGPLNRLNYKMWLPWALIVVLVLVVLFNVVGGKKDATPSADTTPGANTTVAGAAVGTPSLTKTAGAVGTANPATTGTPKATATLSNALPTSTVAPATATPQAKTLAKVVNTQGRGVRMRKDPHVTSASEPDNTVMMIPEGQDVEITGPYKAAEGLNWWPVSYKGKTGWVAQDYLQKKE